MYELIQTVPCRRYMAKVWGHAERQSSTPITVAHGCATVEDDFEIWRTTKGRTIVWH